MDSKADRSSRAVKSLDLRPFACAGIAGSITALGMHVCLLWVLCVVR